MKENGNILSISKADFIRMVGANANVTQYAVEAVLDGMESTLMDIFQDIDKYDKIKVRITKDMQAGVMKSKPTRRKIPGTQDMVDVESKRKPYCKFLSPFKLRLQSDESQNEL